MTKNSCLSTLKIEHGQVRFVHFLSPEKLSRYQKLNRRCSRNDRTRAGRRVPRFLDSLGLSQLRRRKFLSMYVITEFTERGSFAGGNAYSKGSKCAIELPLSSLEGREVYVFNGDVQDLAAPNARKAAYIRFEGDAMALLSSISIWSKELPDARCSQTFICEARLMERLSPQLKPIFHNCIDSPKQEDDISVILDAFFENEDD